MVHDIRVPRLNRYLHWSMSDILVILMDDPLIDSGPWPTGLAVRSISLLICQIYSFDLDCILSSRCYSAIKMILRLDRFICWSVSDIFMILTDDPFFDYGPWPNGLAVKSNLCWSMSAINSFNLNWSVCCPRCYCAIKMILRLDRYLCWSKSAILLISTFDPFIDYGPWPKGPAVKSISSLIYVRYPCNIDGWSFDRFWSVTYWSRGQIDIFVDMSDLFIWSWLYSVFTMLFRDQNDPTVRSIYLLIGVRYIYDIDWWSVFRLWSVT